MICFERCPHFSQSLPKRQAVVGLDHLPWVNVVQVDRAAAHYDAKHQLKSKSCAQYQDRNNSGEKHREAICVDLGNCIDILDYPRNQQTTYCKIQDHQDCPEVVAMEKDRWMEHGETTTRVIHKVHGIENHAIAVQMYVL